MCFLSFVADVIGVIHAGPDLYQSPGVLLYDSANYITQEAAIQMYSVKKVF